MEEARENGKESSHSAHRNGMKVLYNSTHFTLGTVQPAEFL
jgi:hypothetical protein